MPIFHKTVLGEVQVARLHGHFCRTVAISVLCFQDYRTEEGFHDLSVLAPGFQSAVPPCPGKKLKADRLTTEPGRHGAGDMGYRRMDEGIREASTLVELF
ncbi:unnamed protein product [Protopolystoma xenopodis]|uniref:Uncharacterized protein n=1 Tax=Protopolystoma xenopodis TaxID=117903 RepID=A0A3S5BFE5_9PLAT|nr:unnamed protein product [Protopolystoma xenopodis]